MLTTFPRETFDLSGNKFCKLPCPADPERDSKVLLAAVNSRKSVDTKSCCFVEIRRWFVGPTAIRVSLPFTPTVQKPQAEVGSIFHAVDTEKWWTNFHNFRTLGCDWFLCFELLTIIRKWLFVICIPIHSTLWNHSQIASKIARIIYKRSSMETQIFPVANSRGCPSIGLWLAALIEFGVANFCVCRNESCMLL